MNDHTNALSESIQAIGQKILEKANTLQAEQQTLEQLSILESSLSGSIQECKDQHRHIRKNLLEVLRDRHGVELKILQSTLDRKDAFKRLEMYQQQIATREKEWNSLNDLHQEEIKIMSPHLCEIRIHEIKVIHELEEKRDRKRRVKEQLDDLQSKHDGYLSDTADYTKSVEEIEQIIRHLEEAERSEDEEIAALGFQIKAMLEKKTALRNVLYEARERNEVGNERMRLWEEEMLRIRGSL